MRVQRWFALSLSLLASVANGQEAQRAKEVDKVVAPPETRVVPIIQSVEPSEVTRGESVTFRTDAPIPKGAKVNVSLAGVPYGEPCHFSDDRK